VPGEQRQDDEAADRSSLLSRAGVIGADAIGPHDRGSPLIPGPGPPPVEPGEGGDDDWTAHGLSRDEISRWKRLGASPMTAATLTRLGADPDAVESSPVSAEELVGWLWHGFAIHEVPAWLGAESVRKAAQLRDSGCTP
jgi:hypothetical protein